MPLARFTLRNEYGLGVQELYNDAVKVEDSKAVLDGVAVAGLVGILRQLGDLAQFAAEVFHGLQEQVASTASRSRKLVTRMQRVEASLPPLEKSILSQTSHIHFAYTPGSEWHTHIRSEENHFVYDDLPHFIMDSYEECREPPHLQLLDRFDTGGPGSCLKRYSDPTFFRRASASSEAPNGEKSQRERKAREIKRRRLWQRSGRFPNYAPYPNGTSRMQLSSPTSQRQSSLLHTQSPFDMPYRSDMGDQSDSVGSKEGIDFIECVPHRSAPIQPGEVQTMDLSCGLDEELVKALESIYLDEKTAVGGDDVPGSPAVETAVPLSSVVRVTWDEKIEVVESLASNYAIDDILDVLGTNLGSHEQGLKPIDMKSVHQVDDLSEHGSTPKSNLNGNYPNEIIDGNFRVPIGQDCGIDEVQDMLQINNGLDKHDLTSTNVECFTQAANLSESGNNSVSIADENLINDPTDRYLGRDEVQAVPETNFDITNRELETFNAENVSQVDALSEVGNTMKAVECNQLDDVESETDNFVDALNMIESECESDCESQMKKEVLVLTSKVELPTNTIIEQKAEIISHQELLPGFDSQHSTASVSTADMESPENMQSSCNKSEAVAGPEVDAPTCLSDEHSAQRAQLSSAPNIPQGTGFCANADGTKTEPVASEIAASRSLDSLDERTIHTRHVFEETSLGSSSSDRLAFWTNGTLLGLEPSKPVVFNMSDTVNSASTSSGNGVTVGQSTPDTLLKVDASAGTLKKMGEDSKCGDSPKEPEFVDDRQDVRSSKHESYQILDRKHDKSFNYGRNNLMDHAVIHSLSNGNAMPHETKVPVGAYAKNLPSEATDTRKDRSSIVSFLGRGLRRTGSLDYDEKPNPLKWNKFENGCRAAVSHLTPETNLKVKLNSPVNSPPPSPPLEQMKISLRPVDGYETSSLKLKYPQTIGYHASTVDMFPSFQLVPEPTNLKHDCGSDSDNDTFCRSYTFVSEDYLSHLSDSNSEEWGSGETSESSDHALYDGLRRISCTESTSSSPHPEETARGSIHVTSRCSSVAFSDFGPSIDLPTFDTKKFAYRELSLNPEEVESSNFEEPTPQPPPLPPLQWRISRPLLDAAEGKQDSGFDNLNEPFDPKLSGLALPDIAKVVAAKLQSNTEKSAVISKPNKLDEQKLEGQKQNCQTTKGKRADEREDFLHQIRTKSFNLRRTETARSTYAPSTATNNKVTAILQKANAIRQVVGSDDGEDDSWSDT